MLGALAKLWNPMTTSSVILNSGGKKRIARLYYRKSTVILTEERGYMEEECGYIPGRERLYFFNENSGHFCFCLQPRAVHALHSDQCLTFFVNVEVKM
jgi:hypothetical protein